MTVSLVLGDLELVDPAGSPFAIETLADGTGWGNPQPIEVAVRSLLQDGSIVVHQGDDNREVSLRVVITASDSAALAEGEAALMAELYRPNTLTYTPADGWGPPTVFTVITSSLAHVMDDLAEVRLNERHYSVRLVCEPFGRSEDEVVADALPASGTTTTNVNNGSATTNWTGAVNGTSTAPSVVSGAVKVSSGALSGSVTVRLTYTAAITTSATPWLVVDWKPETPADGSTLLAYGDGVALRQDAQIGLPSGYYRTWFYVSAASVAALRLDAVTSGGSLVIGGATASVRSLAVDNIDRTDVRPSSGTTRQLQRSIEVTGSARTQGSLAIEHETDALGDVLVYVWPSEGADATSPSQRQYRVAGGAAVTSDSAMVSGARDAIGAATTTWDIPAAALSGLQTFMVRLSATLGTLSTSMSLTWTVSTRINGTTVGSTYTGTRVITDTTGYEILALDRFLAPAVDVDPNSTTAVVRVTLTGSHVDGSPPGINLDEAWLFGDAGRLTQVACGTGAAASGGPARRVFIEPATSSRPRPVVRIGHAADGSDSFHPPGNALGAWQFPEFRPGLVNVFTVTTNAQDAAVSLRHFPHWFTHAVT